MRITLGQDEAAKVYQRADNEDESCQVRFYEGARYLTLGKHREAQAALAECLKSTSDLMEKGLGKCEMDSAREATPDSASSDKELLQISGTMVTDILRELVRKGLVRVSTDPDNLFPAPGDNLSQTTSILSDVVTLLWHGKTPEQVTEAVSIYLEEQRIPRKWPDLW